MREDEDRVKKQVETVETTLTAEEERILRMRAGASVDPDAPLGSKLDGVAEAHRADVAARLALIEAELLGQLAEAEAEETLDADRKQRIVDALKTKDD